MLAPIDFVLSRIEFNTCRSEDESKVMHSQTLKASNSIELLTPSFAWILVLQGVEQDGAEWNPLLPLSRPHRLHDEIHGIGAAQSFSFGKAEKGSRLSCLRQVGIARKKGTNSAV